MNLSMMAPNNHFILNTLPVEPVSRTYQYRKIMKPMLERKRRARINKCLDELKDLMTGTLQEDGENVSKLEKADILELTVRHLHRLREHNALFLDRVNWMNSSNRNYNHNTNDNDYNYGNHNNYNKINIEKFWAGFQHCIAEVSQFLSKYDHSISNELIQHIENYIPNLMTATMAAAAAKAVNAATVLTTTTTATTLTPPKRITQERTSPIGKSLATTIPSSAPTAPAAVGPEINHLMIANAASSSSFTSATTIDYQRHMTSRRIAASNRIDDGKGFETGLGVGPVRIRFQHGGNYSRIETKACNRQRHEMFNAVWRPW